MLNILARHERQIERDFRQAQHELELQQYARHTQVDPFYAVIGEVALSRVLVFSATLLVETMIHLQRRDPGFRSDHLLLGHIYIPPTRYPDAAAITRFCDEFVKRVRAGPGVVDATITTGYPPRIGWGQMFTVAGMAPSRIADVPMARFAAVDPHYLRALGLSLAAGRDFSESDLPDGPPAAIVNEEFVRRYLPNRHPIGSQIRPGPPPGIPALPLHDFGNSSRNITIIGVVRNFINDGPALPPLPQIFALFGQQPGLNAGFKDIVVRTAMDPESVAPPVSRELRALDPDIPLGEVRTMEDHLGAQTADTRFTTALLALFASLGTVLALIGAYGVVVYLVAQRTQEFGVRMALGANSKDILWLVLRPGLSIGLTGVLLGIAGATVVRQFLTRLLYGISASDPVTLVGTAVLLLLVIVIACAIPARRAMRIDPAEALRNE